MNKNVILYFTDLEGTMLREKDGQYDREELYKLFGQLSDLQNSLQADVKINIVSPIFMEQMKKLVSHFNLEIARYNRSNPSSRLDEINAGRPDQSTLHDPASRMPSDDHHPCNSASCIFDSDIPDSMDQ